MSKAMKTNENRDLKTSQTTWRQTASTLLYLASRLPASFSRAHLLGLSKGSQEAGSSDQFDHLGQGLPRLAEPWYLLPCMSMHVSNVSLELFWRTHKQCKCAEPWVTCVISQWRSKGLRLYVYYCPVLGLDVFRGLKLSQISQHLWKCNWISIDILGSIKEIHAKFIPNCKHQIQRRQVPIAPGLAAEFSVKVKYIEIRGLWQVLKSDVSMLHTSHKESKPCWSAHRSTGASIFPLCEKQYAPQSQFSRAGRAHQAPMPLVPQHCHLQHWRIGSV